jgi:hypothetical protein
VVAGYWRQRRIVPVVRLPRVGVAVVVVGRHDRQALVVVLGSRQVAQLDALCSRGNALCQRAWCRRGRLCTTMSCGVDEGFGLA